MRLLHVGTLEVEEFLEPPRYAILSHTWEQEPSLQAWQSSSQGERRGYAKAAGAARQAAFDGLTYIWIDSICIDKTSSAELSEAINSMFRWYERAEVCYAYLSDVDFEEPDLAGLGNRKSPLHNSRWFTRGWTLQELIAPSTLVFYSRTWTRIGTRDQLGPLLSLITGIGMQYLMRARSLRPKGKATSSSEARTTPAPTPFYRATIAERLSWVSNRVTTRPEDIAYCLLGLFRINMPLLYGEGENAWIRLQKELIASSDDETIFAWSSFHLTDGFDDDYDSDPGDGSEAGADSTTKQEVLDDHDDQAPTIRLEHLKRTEWKPPAGSTMFAPDPVNFFAPEGYLRLSAERKQLYSMTNADLYMRKQPYSMTNAGLYMKLPLMGVGPRWSGQASPNWFCLAVLRSSPAISESGPSHRTCDAVLLQASGTTEDAWRRRTAGFLVAVSRLTRSTSTPAIRRRSTSRMQTEVILSSRRESLPIKTFSPIISRARTFMGSG
jgi:hypothetical protein